MTLTPRCLNFFFFLAIVNALEINNENEFEFISGETYKYENKEKGSFRREFYENGRNIFQRYASYKKTLIQFKPGPLPPPPSPSPSTPEFSEKEPAKLSSSRNIPTDLVDNIEEKAFEEYDWRNEGAVTEVKNQGENCDASWAFSVTGALEAYHFSKTNKLISLSEQFLLDGLTKKENRGCNATDRKTMRGAYDFVLENGICAEDSYPYTGKPKKLKKSGHDLVKPYPRNVTTLPVQKGNSLHWLQKAIKSKGPVSVIIKVHPSTFGKFTGDGIYDIEKEPRKNKKEVAVLFIGYGNHKGKNYWLAKNSLGKDWGDRGYVKLPYSEKNNNSMIQYAILPNYIE